jgi:hypothetical protein
MQVYWNDSKHLFTIWHYDNLFTLYVLCDPANTDDRTPHVTYNISVSGNAQVAVGPNASFTV